MRSYITCSLPSIFKVIKKVKEDKMGVTCSMHWAKLSGFWWEIPKESNCWENLDVGGMIIFKRSLGWAVNDWVDLAEDRDQWRALVNMLMNLWIPENVGKFMSS
jgi:hypothetical protein